MHDRLTAAAWSALLRSVGVLPWPLGQRIAGSIGQWLASGDTRAARVTATNLGRCLPASSETERHALARASLRETGKLVFETAALWSGDAQRWQRYVRHVRGLELIETALAARTGVLVLAPHFGNWELLNCLLGARYRATVMYEPPRNRHIEARIRRARAATGSVLVPTTVAGLRDVLRRLEAGGVAALLPDQVPMRASGVHAPFFGISALTMTLPQRLLLRSRAVALLGGAIRNPQGTFDVAFEPIDDAIRAEDPLTAATALNAAIETFVRGDLAQYQWEYKRFKRPPVGVRSLYG